MEEGYHSNYQPEKLVRFGSRGRLLVPKRLDFNDPLIPSCEFGPAGGPNPTEDDLDNLLLSEIYHHQLHEVEIESPPLSPQIEPLSENWYLVGRGSSFSFPLLSSDVFNSLGLKEINPTPPHSRCGSDSSESEYLEFITLGELLRLEQLNEGYMNPSRSNGDVEVDMNVVDGDGVVKNPKKIGIWWKFGFIFKCCVIP